MALNRPIAAHRQGVYRYGLNVCRTTEDAEGGNPGDPLLPRNCIVDHLVADGADPEAALASRQRVELLAGSLAVLDPVHREAVLLRDIQELSAPEAAAQLGISIDTPTHDAEPEAASRR